MKTLPKLSEYVKRLDVSSNFKTDTQDLEEIIDYTNFITQPLNLSHFVPAKLVDEFWIILEEPKEPESPYNDKQCDIWAQYEIYKSRYQTALENVIFKGFEVSEILGRSEYHLRIAHSEKDFMPFRKVNNTDKWTIKDSIFDIEELIPYNLEITDKIAEKFKI